MSPVILGAIAVVTVVVAVMACTLYVVDAVNREALTTRLRVGAVEALVNTRLDQVHSISLAATEPVNPSAETTQEKKKRIGTRNRNDFFICSQIVYKYKYDCSIY